MGNAAATIIAADVAMGSAVSRAARGPKDARRKDAKRSASRVTAKLDAVAESRVAIARPARANRSNAAIVAMAAVRRASRVSRANRVNRAARLVPRFAAKAAAMGVTKDVAKDVQIAARAGSSRIARHARHPDLASKASRKAWSP